MPRANPPVRKRHNQMNAMLKAADGTVSLFIHHRCKTLLRGLETVKLKPGAQHVETETREQHVTTALGCLVARLFPARRYVKSGRKRWKSWGSVAWNTVLCGAVLRRPQKLLVRVVSTKSVDLLLQLRDSVEQFQSQPVRSTHAVDHPERRKHADVTGRAERVVLPQDHDGENKPWEHRSRHYQRARPARAANAACPAHSRRSISLPMSYILRVPKNITWA